jgi:hypothetical protein
VGVLPLPEKELIEILQKNPPAPIATDQDIQFALDMNRNLN